MTIELASATLAEEARKELSQWLTQIKFTYFLTVTFRKEQHPTLSLSTLLSVKRTLSAFRPRCLYLGAEPSPSRYWHVHGLMEPSSLIESPEWLWKRLWDRHGFSRVEVIDKPHAVSHYVTKYVTKHRGEWLIA